MLTQQQAKRILGAQEAVDVSRLRTHNHVYRLESSGSAFILKTFTKDWYGGTPDEADFCVYHEASAGQLLARHGLPVPEVVTESYGQGNPVGRPFLITRELEGEPLPVVLGHVDPPQFRQALRAVGSYLGAMHSITFNYPGFVLGDGPDHPPDPSEWQHPAWTPEAFERAARRVWDRDARQVPEALMRLVEEFHQAQRGALQQAFTPPRFTHGDCHAHHVYLARARRRWRVTGIIDLELASAGDCRSDLAKFVVEMSGDFTSSTRWWEPLFQGYGATPDLDLLRLRLMALGHANYTSLGGEGWRGLSRERILRHLLAAEDWETLLEPRGLSRSASSH